MEPADEAAPPRSAGAARPASEEPLARTYERQAAVVEALGRSHPLPRRQALAAALVAEVSSKLAPLLQQHAQDRELEFISQHAAAATRAVDALLAALKSGSEGPRLCAQRPQDLSSLVEARDWIAGLAAHDGEPPGATPAAAASGHPDDVPQSAPAARNAQAIANLIVWQYVKHLRKPPAFRKRPAARAGAAKDIGEHSSTPFTRLCDLAEAWAFDAGLALKLTDAVRRSAVERGQAAARRRNPAGGGV